jgi:hypothetical protein
MAEAPPDPPEVDPFEDMANFLITDEGLGWLSSQVIPEWANEQQTLAMRAYHEAAKAFIRYQRNLDRTRIEMMNAQQPIPSDLHERFLGELRDCYRAFYDLMERVMKVAVLYQTAFSGSPPPSRSVERFIDWLESMEFATDRAAWILRQARDFRTLLTHSAELPAWDWMTFEIPADDGSPIILLRIFGEGPGPTRGHAHEAEPGLPGTWHVLSPVDSAVTRAFVVTVWRMFSRITGQMMSEGRSLD